MFKDTYDLDLSSRWNFSDFFHSYMMVFRGICGQWMGPMWDCVRRVEENGTSVSVTY